MQKPNKLVKIFFNSKASTNPAATPNTANTASSNSTAASQGNGPEINENNSTSYAYTGWVKFFKFNNKTADAPKGFFINNYFYKQNTLYPGIDVSAKSSNNQFKYVPSKNFWFSTLFKDSLNFANSREVRINIKNSSASEQLTPPSKSPI